MIIAEILGYLAIICYVFLCTPQLYLNFKLKSSEALSFWFVGIMTLADTCSFAGAILNILGRSQIILCGYLVAVDVCLILQSIYYRHLQHRHPLTLNINSTDQDLNSNESIEPLLLHDKLQCRSRSASNRFLLQNSVIITLSCICLFMVPGVLPLQLEPSNTPLEAFSSTYALHSITRYDIGIGIGYISTTLYILSRLPQIIRNHQRKTCSGLSITMYAISIIASFLYTSSLSLSAFSSTSTPTTFKLNTEVLFRSMPWIASSTILMILDCVVLVQYFLLSERVADELVDVV